MIAARRNPTVLGLAAVLLVVVGLGTAAPVLTHADASAGFWARAVRMISLRDHNTRVVLIGTSLLGMSAGVVGTFMLLRKRALVGDALSHATLPGIALAFMVMTHLGMDGKSLVGLLAGGVITSVAGLACVLLIRRTTRVKDDAALGIVLGVFFGLGVALLGVIQSMRGGNAAGLESFIYGKTASMLTSDAVLIAVAAVGVVLVCALLFKEFALICFDVPYAGSQGWPVLWLDVVLMGLVVIVTVIGLQAVGLILVIALLVTPPAAARFWTDRLDVTVIVAAVIGAASGLVGAGLSAMVPRLPAGAIIVSVATAVFIASLVFGTTRGVLVRVIQHLGLTQRIAEQHLLRAMYESAEASQRGSAVSNDRAVGWSSLIDARSWSQRELRRLIGRARRHGWIVEAPAPSQRTSTDVAAQSANDPGTSDRWFRLTETGLAEASRVIRNHRLWEMYLITHADVAPSHVDRDADQVEHVLGPEMVRSLIELLEVQGRGASVPPSPHVVGVPPALPR